MATLEEREAAITSAATQAREGIPVARAESSKLSAETFGLIFKSSQLILALHGEVERNDGLYAYMPRVLRNRLKELAEEIERGEAEPLTVLLVLVLLIGGILYLLGVR